MIIGCQNHNYFENNSTGYYSLVKQLTDGKTQLIFKKLVGKQVFPHVWFLFSPLFFLCCLQLTHAYNPYIVNIPLLLLFCPNFLEYFLCIITNLRYLNVVWRQLDLLDFLDSFSPLIQEVSLILNLTEEASWMRGEKLSRKSSKSSCLWTTLRYIMTWMTENLHQHKSEMSVLNLIRRK